MNTKIPIFTIVLILSSLLLAKAQEIVFKNGLNNYSLAEDTTLDGSSEQLETRNHGHNPTLEVAGVAWGGIKKLGLIKFPEITKNPSIPVGSRITSAKLRLFKIGEPADAGQYEKSERSQLNIDVFPLIKPWSAGTGPEDTEKGATFAFRDGDTQGKIEFWGESEKPESSPVKGIDYVSENSSKARLQPGEINYWEEWDVTEIVQKWIDNPKENFGFLISARGYYIGAYFASCENGDQNRNPELIINF